MLPLIQIWQFSIPIVTSTSNISIAVRNMYIDILNHLYCIVLRQKYCNIGIFQYIVASLVDAYYTHFLAEVVWPVAIVEALNEM